MSAAGTGERLQTRRRNINQQQLGARCGGLSSFRLEPLAFPGVRILLASVDDVENTRAWSGTPYHMYQALLSFHDAEGERLGTVRMARGCRFKLGMHCWAKHRRKTFKR